MTKKIVDFIILFFCVVIAVLLYRSTADFPSVSQNSTANYIRFLALSTGILSLLQIYYSYRKNDNDCIMITYTNSLAASYNKDIRNELFPGKESICIGVLAPH